MTGVNFSSWYRQDEGAFFVDYTEPNNVKAIFYVGDDTNNNRMALLRDGAGTATLYVTSSGAAQAAITKSAITVGASVKSSISYKTDDFLFVRNGDAAGTDTTVIVPVVNQLRIGQNSSSLPTSVLNGYIKRLTYYNQALTAANLQAITR
jgi:hypothetical protein